MKKFRLPILILLLSVITAACSPSKDFKPDYESAIGAIFVNAQQELPEKTKVYAELEDNSYTFDLDAAYVYFFYANSDEGYAGDMNFKSMTFGAQSDTGSVGAEGTVAYLYNEVEENSVFAYYLYHDETGVYFNTGACFDKAEITDGHIVTGSDYSCTVTFNIEQPVSSLCIAYNKDGGVVSKTDYTAEEITDYQVFDLESDISSVTVFCYDAEKNELSAETVTRENPNAVFCFDRGGQILGSKLLHFNWQE